MTTATVTGTTAPKATKAEITAPKGGTQTVAPRRALRQGGQGQRQDPERDQPRARPQPVPDAQAGARPGSQG